MCAKPTPPGGSCGFDNSRDVGPRRWKPSRSLVGRTFPDAERPPLSRRWRATEAFCCPRLAFERGESGHLLPSLGLTDGRAESISLDPATGSLRGAQATDHERLHLRRVMEAFAAAATRFVRGLLPDYAANLEGARTSYRPIEIAGRRCALLKDGTLLHVGAFPSASAWCRCILRFFFNISPLRERRIWRVDEPFRDFAQKFLPSLGGPAGGIAWLLAAVGATRGRPAPTTS
jgi:hypothetical protein